MKKRESNYDLLRIVCTIAVIAIHVCASYITSYGFQNKNYVFITYLIDALGRFAVPCFLMLSGAFLLADEENRNYKYFYKKSFKNIGIPLLIFTFLYFFYSVFKYAIKIFLYQAPLVGLIEPVKNLIKGWPFYHMWYLYMLVGVYLLVPIFIRLKDDIGDKKFAIFSYVFLFFASLSVFTSTHKMYWDIGNAFCYSSYLLVGYCIKRKISSISFKHPNGVGLFKIVLGGLLLMLTAFLKMLQKYKGIFLGYKVFSPFCPIVVIGSLLIFSGFSSLRMKRDFSKVSSYTFLIYLVHAGIWDILLFIFKRNSVVPSFYYIPFWTFIVFVLSLFFSYFITCGVKIWQRKR